ncbi:hypothetical protein AKO1_015288, partial [Acrasis kona]
IILLILYVIHAKQTESLVYTLTDQNFSNTTQSYNHSIILCRNPWDTIADDKMIIINQLAHHFQDLKTSKELCFGSLDIRSNPETQKHYSLIVSPLLLLFRNGTLVSEYKWVTTRSDDMVKVIERFLVNKDITDLTHQSHQQRKDFFTKDENTIIGFFTFESHLSEDEGALVALSFEDVHESYVLTSELLRYEFNFALISSTHQNVLNVTNATTINNSFGDEMIVEERDTSRSLYLLVDDFLTVYNVSNRDEVLQELSKSDDPKGFITAYNREKNILRVFPSHLTYIQLGDWIVDNIHNVITEMTTRRFQRDMNKKLPVSILFSNDESDLSIYRSAVINMDTSVKHTFMNGFKFASLKKRIYPTGFGTNKTLPIFVIDPVKKRIHKCENCYSKEKIIHFLKGWWKVKHYRLSTPSTQPHKLSHDTLKELLHTQCTNEKNISFLLIYSSSCVTSRQVRFEYESIRDQNKNTTFYTIDSTYNDLPFKVDQVPKIVLLTAGGTNGKLNCNVLKKTSSYKRNNIEGLGEWVEKNIKKLNATLDQ